MVPCDHGTWTEPGLNEHVSRLTMTTNDLKDLAKDMRPNKKGCPYPQVNNTTTFWIKPENCNLTVDGVRDTTVHGYLTPKEGFARFDSFLRPSFWLEINFHPPLAYHPDANFLIDDEQEEMSKSHKEITHSWPIPKTACKGGQHAKYSGLIIFQEDATIAQFLGHEYSEGYNNFVEKKFQLTLKGITDLLNKVLPKSEL